MTGFEMQKRGLERQDATQFSHILSPILAHIKRNNSFSNKKLFFLFVTFIESQLCCSDN